MKGRFQVSTYEKSVPAGPGECQAAVLDFFAVDQDLPRVGSVDGWRF
jgi:hypothetical protein